MLKREALQILDQKVAGCTKCSELSSYRTINNYKTVPGVGDPSAKLLILGEAPGENEAKQGIPFCGKAGNLLTNILSACGFTREQVFITNILKCRPPGNRDPEPCEANNCRKFLDLQIRIIEPEWIVCFGRIASVHLLGEDTSTLIGELRGKVHNYNNIKVICTYHPAFVLHSQEENKKKEAKAAIWTDLQPMILSLRRKQTVV